MKQNNQMMTEVSARQWDFIAKECQTPKEAVDFLKSGMRLRTFSDIICRLYPGKDLENRLTDRLFAFCGANADTTQRDSIRRKVQNWLHNRNLPTDREDVFQIAFALELDEKQTDWLLAQVFDAGIHYRNEKEIIYAFSLRNHQSYEKASVCAKTFAERKSASDTTGNAVTKLLKMEFEQLPPDEDIINFMMKHSESFGKNHNTAYQYFIQMLDLLTGEKSGEEVYSMEYITEQYLRMNMPEDKKVSGYSDIQRMVKKYWPGVRNIKEMKNRNEDVTRKALLLLYIVTGGVWTETYDELDEAYVTSEEMLIEHCKRINKMLEDCGMRYMDTRNPFDYLVLFCLKSKRSEFMSERMEQMVEELFAEK